MYGWTCNPEENIGFSCQCVGTDCDETEVDGLKYYVFGERISWLEAKADCEERGFILASVVTENDFNAARAFVSRYNKLNRRLLSFSNIITSVLVISLARIYG